MQYLKHIKAFFIILAFLFGVITLLSLIIPSNVLSAKSIDVTGEKTAIYNQIADLREWKNWHPFLMQVDGSKQIKISSDSSSSLNWEMNGRNFSIKKVSADSANIRFEFKKDDGDVQDIYYSIQQHEQSDLYTVEVKSIEHLRWYPWEKFRGLFYEQAQGPFLEMSLKNLKDFLEKGSATGN